MKLSIPVYSFVMTFIFVLTSFIGIQAQTTAFTYQGRLTDASMPATNGTYDFEFALFNLALGGTQVGTAQAISGVSVSNESFSVQLDFGAIPFSGADRYLEIRVKKQTDSGYTTLSPRQRITSTPYSVRALSAGTAVSAFNADTLDNIDSSSFVRTDSYRFIRNLTPNQPDVNFEITGTGKAYVFDAYTQYNIEGKRVLSVTGIDNFVAGVGAGAGNVGVFNSFVGARAGASNGEGNQNSFFGTEAGLKNWSGDRNSFFGRSAGLQNTVGSDNSFLGNFAGSYNTTGKNNSFVGSNAGFNNHSGSNNTIIGYKADVTANNLTFATALGSNAVVSTNDTIVLGKVAGYYDNIQRPADTVQIPGNLTVNGTLSANINGSSITNLNGSNITTGTLDNARLGIIPIINGGTGSATQNFVDLSTNQLIAGDKTFSNTLSGNTVNSATEYNIRGNRILSSMGDGNDLFIGIGAGASSTQINGNTLVGMYAGNSNTTGLQNSFFGLWAGRANTTGGANAFFGSRAGVSNTTGNYNSFFGYNTGFSNTTGEVNSFFGHAAGFNNTSGFRNSFFGVQAGTNNTIGNYNAFFGGWAGYSNSGEHNSFMGDNAGRNNTSGSRNSFFGKDAGLGNTAGSSNTLMGNKAEVGAGNLTYATAIGAEAVVSTSNTVVLGRTADTVVAPNLLQVNTLGTDGSTPLCRNNLNQISTCTGANSTENSLVEQNTVTAKAFDEQRAQIQAQQTQIEQQQKEINELKAIVCSIKSDAAVCKGTKK